MSALRERVEALAAEWSLTEFPDEATANTMRLDLARLLDSADRDALERYVKEDDK